MSWDLSLPLRNTRKFYDIVLNTIETISSTHYIREVSAFPPKSVKSLYDPWGELASKLEDEKFRAEYVHLVIYYPGSDTSSYSTFRYLLDFHALLFGCFTF